MTTIGEWAVDLARGTLEREGEVRVLTTRETGLLRYLLNHTGQDLSRDELLREVWGYSDQAVTRAVDHTVMRLRAKLEDEPSNPRYLLTLHGTGYRLESDAPTAIVPSPPVRPASRPTLRLGRVVVDLGRHSVRGDGDPVGLTAMEARLLTVLWHRSPSVVARADLLKEVWTTSATHASQTRAVDHLVTRLRKKIEEDPSSPRHLVGVHGVGYRLEGVSAPEVREHDQGPAPSDVVGRESETTQVQSLLEGGSRWVTLWGAGGMGKTSLANHVADVMRENGTEVLFTDLAGATDAWGILVALRSALGMEVDGWSSLDQATRAVGYAMREHARAVVILDNVEQVDTHAMSLIELWLECTTETRFLVTSRTPLRHKQEHVVEVGPLSDEPAGRLFATRVSAHGSTVNPTDPNVQAIIRRLEGSPLAIGLAAVQVQALGVLRVAQDLERAVGTLATTEHGWVDRHRSLHASLLWSWRLLSDTQRAVLVQAAAFRGGFTASMAAEFWGTEDDVLDTLVLRSLVHRRASADDPEEPRYDMYVVIREAIEAVDPIGSAAAHLRHAAYFADAIRRRADPLRIGLPDVRWLSTERSNLLAAHARGSGVGQDLAVLSIGVALGDPLAAATDRQNHAHHDDAVLAAEAHHAEGLLSWALIVRAAARLRAGALTLAEADLVRAADSSPQSAQMAWVRRQQGVLFRRRGEPDRANAAFSEAAALVDAEGIDGLRGRMLVDLGWSSILTRPEHATVCFERAATWARQTGDDQVQADAVSGLAAVAAYGNQLALAASRLRLAVTIAERIRGTPPSGMVGNLGLTLMNLGHMDEGMEWLRRSADLARQEGNEEFVCRAILQLSAGLLELERRPEARAELESAAALVTGLGRWHYTHVAYATWGFLEWLDGQPAVAASWFRSAADSALPGDPALARLWTALEQAALQHGVGPEVYEAVREGGGYGASDDSSVLSRLVRRLPQAPTEPSLGIHTLQIGPTIVYLDEFRVEGPRGSATLTPMEASTLRYFADRLGEVVPRAMLERDVWGHRDGVSSEAAPVFIRRLRSKLGGDHENEALQTVRGVGWRLMAVTLGVGPPPPGTYS